MKNCNDSVPGNHYAGNAKQKRFKVYKIGRRVNIHPADMRRDFGKIFLITGKADIHFEGKAIQTSGPILFFEPLAPYSLNELPGNDLNFACLYSRNFLEFGSCWKTYSKLMTFADSSGPVYFSLDLKQEYFVSKVFERMILEQDSGYMFNHELFCDYLNLIFHEVLKRISPKAPGYKSFHLN